MKNLNLNNVSNLGKINKNHIRNKEGIQEIGNFDL